MNCAIGHDCRLGDYSSFSPGANLGGHTSIGEFSEIGIGASTVQSVKIGSNVKLGAGAVVSKSLPDNCTAIGIPAKPIKFCQ
jgi:serine acetyltransferase